MFEKIWKYACDVMTHLPDAHEENRRHANRATRRRDRRFEVNTHIHTSMRRSRAFDTTYGKSRSR